MGKRALYSKRHSLQTRMIPAHYITKVHVKFNGMTSREFEIYKQAFQDGQHCARNEAQPRLGDLEIRIDKATSLVRDAIEALYKPSF